MRQNAESVEGCCGRLKRRIEKQGDAIALAHQIKLAVSFAHDAEQMVSLGTLGVQRNRVSQMDDRRCEASTVGTLPSSFETCGYLPWPSRGNCVGRSHRTTRLRKSSLSDGTSTEVTPAAFIAPATSSRRVSLPNTASGTSGRISTDRLYRGELRSARFLMKS